MIAKMKAPLLTRLFAVMLLELVKLTLLIKALGQNVKFRANAIGVSMSLIFMGAIAFAQSTLDGTGNTKPDAALSGAVCGSGGWLSWFTSTKFLVVILAGGLIGFLIGRAIGKRDNDGITGVITAVLGLGAIRLLIKVVTTC